MNERQKIERSHQVQAKGLQKRGGESSDQVHQAAEAGLSGGGGTMPFADRIQESFGSFDVSGIRAHTGGAAQKANEKMGSMAYATGNNVAFRGAPDLFTAAHEAAHVIQQQAGVQLRGGVGEAGDRYERHADEVAARVVQGKSAEDLLTQFTGRGAKAPVQARSQTQKKTQHRAQGTRHPVQKRGAAIQRRAPVQMNPTTRRYNPPAGTPPRVPPDARIVDVDTSGLYEAVSRLNWAAAGRDPTWSGFSIMRRICSTNYWRAGSRLTDGVSQNLSYSTTWMDNTYRLEITPVMTGCPSSQAPGGAYSDQASGGSEVSASDSASNGVSVTANAGLDQNSAEGTPSASGGVEVGGSTEVTREQGTTDSASGQQGTSADTSISFNATMTFNIRLTMELGASTFGNIVTLGGGELGSELAEVGPQSASVGGKSMTFTLPLIRCRAV